MKLTQAIFLLSAMFLSACTDIKESEHASTLLAMHQKYFDYQNQDTSPETPHPNRSEVSIPQFEIQLLNADHTPAASADYQIRQYNSLGFSVPGTPLKTDFGATNETGYIQVNRTDKGLFAALYLSGNGLPFYFAQPLSLRGFDSDLIKITIPEKRIYSGRVAPSFSGESQPVQVWAWQNSEFTRIPLLPLLPAKYLLHCDELELLQDAEFVSDIRNSTDLRVEEPSYFELSLGENNEYTFTGTAQEPTICVLDNQGRFQWFKLDPESTRTQIFTLRDPSEHVIKIVDEFGEPAVGAFVATASGGRVGMNQILRPCGVVPANGEMRVQGNPGEFLTMAARWDVKDPWFTWEWVNADSQGKTPHYPATLTRPESVEIRVVDLQGNAIQSGTVHVVSSAFQFDPTQSGIHSPQPLNSQGIVKFERLQDPYYLTYLFDSKGWFPMPVDREYSEDYSHQILTVAPLVDLEVSFVDSPLAEGFFPAAILVGINHGESPVLQWVSAGQTCNFIDICGAQSKVDVFGANGNHISCYWDGKASEVVVPWVF